jgi:S1-C subfamily serine protease
MSASTLLAFSDDLAAAVTTIEPAVVQVHGNRRPASGVVHSSGVVVTTMRAIGREDGLRVVGTNGQAIDAELIGWDPATTVAVLRANGLASTPATLADKPARVGHLAIAVARSWSNAITATMGLVSVIGGPLPTGRRRSIQEVIRTSAPMHGGFAGGAFVDPGGRLVGVTTAAEIRGLGVVIPAAIAWAAASTLLTHGRVKRGYLGIAGQPVRLGGGAGVPETGLLVVGVTADSPASAARFIVGDVMVAFDGQPVQSPEDLLDLLVGERVGRIVKARVLRGGSPLEIDVTVGERQG